MAEYHWVADSTTGEFLRGGVMPADGAPPFSPPVGAGEVAVVMVDRDPDMRTERHDPASGTKRRAATPQEETDHDLSLATLTMNDKSHKAMLNAMRALVFEHGPDQPVEDQWSNADVRNDAIARLASMEP